MSTSNHKTPAQLYFKYLGVREKYSSSSNKLIPNSSRSLTSNNNHYSKSNKSIFFGKRPYHRVLWAPAEQPYGLAELILVYIHLQWYVHKNRML